MTAVSLDFMTPTSDPLAATMTAPAFLVAPTGARYRLAPEVPAPWPGAGWPAWDEAWGRYVLVRFLDGQDALRVAHYARMLMQLNHPGLLHVFAVCDPHAASHAAAVIEWPTGEPLFAALARGPLSLVDYTHFCWQTLGTLAVLQEHGIVVSRLAVDTLFQAQSMPGSPPLFKLIEPSSLAQTPPSVDDNPFRGVLHQFGLLSWRTLTGHDWHLQGDAGAILTQMRPDISGAAVGWIAATLHPDIAQRPADARAMLNGMESALRGYPQMVPSWPMQQAPMAVPPPWAQASQPQIEVAQLTAPLTAPIQASAVQSEEFSDVEPVQNEALESESPVDQSPPETLIPPPSVEVPVLAENTVPPPPTAAPMARPVSSPTKPLVGGRSSADTALTSSKEPPIKKSVNVAMIISLVASVAIFAVCWPFVWGPVLGSFVKKPYIEDSSDKKEANPSAAAPTIQESQPQK